MGLIYEDDPHLKHVLQQLKVINFSKSFYDILYFFFFFFFFGNNF